MYFLPLFFSPGRNRDCKKNGVCVLVHFVECTRQSSVVCSTESQTVTTHTRCLAQMTHSCASIPSSVITSAEVRINYALQVAECFSSDFTVSAALPSGALARNHKIKGISSYVWTLSQRRE